MLDGLHVMDLVGEFSMFTLKLNNTLCDTKKKTQIEIAQKHNSPENFMNVPMKRITSMKVKIIKRCNHREKPAENPTDDQREIPWRLFLLGLDVPLFSFPQFFHKKFHQCVTGEQISKASAVTS